MSLCFNGECFKTVYFNNKLVLSTGFNGESIVNKERFYEYLSSNKIDGTITSTGYIFYYNNLTITTPKGSIFKEGKGFTMNLTYKSYHLFAKKKTATFKIKFLKELSVLGYNKGITLTGSLYDIEFTYDENLFIRPQDIYFTLTVLPNKEIKINSENIILKPDDGEAYSSYSLDSIDLTMDDNQSVGIFEYR